MNIAYYTALLLTIFNTLVNVMILPDFITPCLLPLYDCCRCCCPRRRLPLAA